MKRALLMILAFLLLVFLTPIQAEDISSSKTCKELDEVLEPLQEKYRYQNEIVWPQESTCSDCQVQACYEQMESLILKQLAEEKSAVKKELKASNYLFEEHVFEEIETVADFQSLAKLRSDAVQKQSNFEEDKAQILLEIETNWTKIKDKWMDSPWLNKEKLQKTATDLMKTMHQAINESQSDEALEKSYEESLGLLESWDQEQKIEAEANFQAMKKERKEQLTQAISEVQDLYAFFNLDSPDFEARMQDLEEEIEALLLEAEDEATMDDLTSTLLEELALLEEELSLEDLNDVLAQVLDEDNLHIFETLLNWGVLDQADIEAQIRDIVENYEDYLELGLTLKDLFEMQRENLEAMKALYERNHFLPATGRAPSRHLYGLLIFLFGIYLWKKYS